MATTEMATTARTASEVHRFVESNVYPHDESLIAELAADMTAHGFDANFPILTKDVDGSRQIVDGWHRYQASERAGVQPVFVEFVGSADEAFRFILRANGNRRHLTPSQKVAAALLVNRKLEGNSLNAKEISGFSGLADSTVNTYRTYSPEELENIAGGMTVRELMAEKSKAKAKGKGKGKTKVLPTTYTANTKEVRRLGGLSTATGKPVPVIFKEIIDNGLTAMEQKLDGGSNGD